MNKPYTSSIVNQYGDISQVKDDSKALKDIISRQGTKLVLHAIAEHIGEVALEYNLDSTGVSQLTSDLTNELVESIQERT